MVKNLIPIIGLCFLTITTTIFAEENRVTHQNIPYYSQKTLDLADDYQKTQCVVDIIAPKDAENLPVLVWHHGGGLTGGQKDVPPFLKKEPIILVAVGYRLSPKAKFPEFIEDAAAAVAWTFKNIKTYGGDPDRIFVGGYSAGGYLAGMVGCDRHWLENHGIQREKLGGLILLSAQVSTHFHVRELLNLSGPKYLPMIDENAPMHYLSKDLPPIILLLGDRKIEWPARVEENEMMYASLRAMGHKNAEFHENAGYNHGTIGNTQGDFAPEVQQQILAFLRKYGKMPITSEIP